MEQQKKTVFGIDLGTTYSCIAYVNEYGKPEVMRNLDNETTTPSVVYFESADSRIVGKSAKENAILYPDAVVEMVKRHMGEAGWDFKFEGQSFKAEEISSYILRKLVGDAQATVDYPIEDVVITCPAYFGVNETAATRKAGEIAGLNVRYILAEPVAAAIAYGVTQGEDKVIVVYDLGGGTFDVTMIRINAGSTDTVAADGAHALGGRDWDEAVVNYLAEQWMELTGSSDDPRADRETLQDLWIKAEAAKKALTGRFDAAKKTPSIPVKTDVAVNHAGQLERVELDLTTFDRLTSHLLDDTIRYTRRMLAAAAEKGVTTFDEFLLVGGSSFMPQVSARILDEFGLEPRKFIPHEAIANGAALLGQRIAIRDDVETALKELGAPVWKQATKTQRDVAATAAGQMHGLPAAQVATLQDDIRSGGIVASHSFGVVAVRRGSNEEFVANLIKKNTSLPATVTQEFGTDRPNQENADVRVMENILMDTEIDDLELCEEIGKAVLRLPSGLPEGSPIEITFELNEQGLLHATARELTQGGIVDVTIETARVMSEEAVRKALEQSTGIRVI